MKTFQRVQICDMSLIRKPYMTHGLHMNKSGKDWNTKSQAKQIKELFLVTHRTTVIELPWKKDGGI
jgi:hypothetical protein